MPLLYIHILNIWADSVRLLLFQFQRSRTKHLAYPHFSMLWMPWQLCWLQADEWLSLMAWNHKSKSGTLRCPTKQPSRKGQSWDHVEDVLHLFEFRGIAWWKYASWYKQIVFKLRRDIVTCHATTIYANKLLNFQHQLKSNFAVYIW